MQYTPLFFFTYSLLILAMLSVWLRPSLAKPKGHVRVDMALLGVASVTGIVGGFVTLVGALELAGFAALAYYATRSASPRVTAAILSTVVGFLALLLAMHLLPGFNNPRLLDNVRTTQDAIPFTLYANFDKGAAGLVLLAFFCKRTTSWSEFSSDIKKSGARIAGTIVAVIAAALAMHVIKFEPKLPSSTVAFIVTNLFFTCVAEEAFFRGLLQEKLSVALAGAKYGRHLAIACSAILFGLVHISGGLAYVGLATIAGLGYACIYSATRRIEVPIATHFLFNLIHFTCFTYPLLA